VTGPSQYLAAESLLDALDELGVVDGVADPALSIEHLLAAAQVRATLALAAATAAYCDEFTDEWKAVLK
jgi:hypothetical protein